MENNQENKLNDQESFNQKVEIQGLDDQIQKNLDYIQTNMSWEDFELPKEIIENLYSHNFKHPSKIQSHVLNILKKEPEKDIMVQSQNGSGKTLSFLIPCVLKCLQPQDLKNDENLFQPITIILSDTKELCYQSFKICNMIKVKDLKTQVLIKEETNFDYSAHIIFTTIGSFLHYLNKRILNFDNLKFLVLDETDKLFSQDIGRNKLSMVFKKLSQVKKDCSIGMFSATFPKECIQIIQNLNRNLIQVTIEKKEISLKNLTHFYIKCDRPNKLEFMDKFLRKYQLKFFESSVIIFVNSKNFAEQFALKLAEQNHKCEILTSDMSPQDRMLTMNEFKAGKIKILLSTNLISRGIDNRKVGIVINLDMPYYYENGKKIGIDTETYLHRVGRTGRYGDKGIALNIVENQRDLEQIEVIKDQYEINFIEVTIEDFGDIMQKNEVNMNFNQKKRELLEESI